MSLINDALKKAKQAQDNAPVRETAPQLRSPDTDHRRHAGASLLWPGVIVIALLLGGGLVWFGLGARRTEAPLVVANAAVKPAAPTPEPMKIVAATPKVLIQGRPDEAKIAALPPPAMAAPPAPIVAERPATSVAPPPAVLASPMPKLNGIFFNPTRPTAVVNNKLVAAGSRVGEFTVLVITQNSVTLAGGGQTNVLSLSE